MYSKEDLKQKLLQADILENNTYFDKYVDIIFKNLHTALTKDQTQKHHILPRYYFKHHQLSIDNSQGNLVNLNINEHILAHYYLYKCSKAEEEKYSNLYALKRMLGGNFTALEHIEHLNADECLQLYKKYCEHNRRAHLGKTHSTSEETRKKIGDANRNKYQRYVAIYNEAGIEKRIPVEELQRYVDEGWHKGRSQKSIEGLKKGYNYESKGMLGKSQSDFQKARASKALLGQKKSSEARLNMSKARKGKKLYINPQTGQGKYFDATEAQHYKDLGWERKNKK